MIGEGRNPLTVSQMPRNASQQATWLRRLQADHDNLSAAIDWALDHDPEMAVRLTSVLAYFWLIGRRRTEIRQRLAAAMDTARGAPPASRARALVWAAMLAAVEGRPDQAASRAREAYELATDARDPWWIAMCEAVLGLTTGFSGEIGRAGELLEASRTRFGKIGDDWGTALASMLLGYASTFAAQHEQAAALARRGLEGFRAAGDQWGQTMALELLGLLARRRGALDDAIAVHEEALGVVRDLGLRDEVPFLLADLGDLHVHGGDFETAAVLLKEALDLAQDLGAGDAVARARNGLATAARRQGHYGRARELHLQALSFYREAGLAAELAHTLASLGYVEELRGDLDAAEACHQESLRLTLGLADAAPLAAALEGLACAAAARRQPQRTAVLIGAAESVRARTGTPPLPQERADIERATDAAVTALAPQAFTGLVEQGRHMTAAQAATYPPVGDPAP